MKEYVILIFKILFLIIITPLIIVMVIEFSNVYSNSYKLRPLVEISISEAAKTFSEESFVLGAKGNGASAPKDLYQNLIGKRNPSNPTGYQGIITVGDEIFDSKSEPHDIYEYLMNGSDTSIKDFGFNSNLTVFDSTDNPVSSWHGPADKFKNLDLILDNSNPIGAVYRANYVTPMNLGIPYLDDLTVTAMAKWNTAHALCIAGEQDTSSITLSNNLDTLYRDSLGSYIFWHGFRVYVSEMELNVRYLLLDMSNSADRDKFETETSMSAETLFGDSVIESIGNEKYFILTYIDYSIPIIYEGVTPWRQLASWLYTGAFTSNTTETGNSLDAGSSTRDMLHTEGTGVGGLREFKDGVSSGINFSLTGRQLQLTRDLAADMTGTIKHYIVK